MVMLYLYLITFCTALLVYDTRTEYISPVIFSQKNVQTNFYHKGSLLGGYRSIDINREDLLSIAKNAVMDKCSGSNVISDCDLPNSPIIKVKTAESQVVAGTNYHLIVQVCSTSDIDCKSNGEWYDIIVFVSLEGNAETTQFKHISSPVQK